MVGILWGESLAQLQRRIPRSCFSPTPASGKPSMRTIFDPTMPLTRWFLRSTAGELEEVNGIANPSTPHAKREEPIDADEGCRYGAERNQRLVGEVADGVASARPRESPRERAHHRDQRIAPEPHPRRPRHTRRDRVQLGKESAAEEKSNLMTAKTPFRAVDILGGSS